MSIYHDEVEIEDMEYDDESEMYYYPCPCGDKFQISKVGTIRKYRCRLPKSKHDSLLFPKLCTQCPERKPAIFYT